MKLVDWGVGKWGQLTSNHAMKLVLAVSCSVGDYNAPVGELVGYGGMESISQMTNAVAMFLDSTNCIKLLTAVE